MSVQNMLRNHFLTLPKQFKLLSGLGFFIFGFPLLFYRNLFAHYQFQTQSKYETPFSKNHFITSQSK